MNEIRIGDIHLGSEVEYITPYDERLYYRKGTVTGINFESGSSYSIEVDHSYNIPLSRIRSVETQYTPFDFTAPVSISTFQRPWATGVGKNLLSAFNKSNVEISKIVFNGPATIVWFNDGTKTIVKKTEDDADDREKAILLALTKKLLGNSTANLRKYLKDAESKVDNQNKKGK